MIDDGAGSGHDHTPDALEATRGAGVGDLVHILDAGEGNTLLLDRALDHLATSTGKEGALDTAPGRDPTGQGRNRSDPDRIPETIRSQRRLEVSESEKARNTTTHPKENGRKILTEMQLMRT